jgi:hypothetical protein
MGSKVFMGVLWVSVYSVVAVADEKAVPTNFMVPCSGRRPFPIKTSEPKLRTEFCQGMSLI